MLSSLAASFSNMYLVRLLWITIVVHNFFERVNWCTYWIGIINTPSRVVDSWSIDNIVVSHLDVMGGRVVFFLIVFKVLDSRSSMYNELCFPLFNQKPNIIVCLWLVRSLNNTLVSYSKCSRTVYSNWRRKMEIRWFLKRFSGGNVFAAIEEDATNFGFSCGDHDTTNTLTESEYVIWMLINNWSRSWWTKSWI